MMTDKLRAAHDKLLEAVADIVSGDDWKRMLTVASKFHRYSFNNHQVDPPSDGHFVLRLRAVVGLRPKRRRIHSLVCDFGYNVQLRLTRCSRLPNPAVLSRRSRSPRSYSRCRAREDAA